MYSTATHLEQAAGLAGSRLAWRRVRPSVGAYAELRVAAADVAVAEQACPEVKSIAKPFAAGMPSTSFATRIDVNASPIHVATRRGAPPS